MGKKLLILFIFLGLCKTVYADDLSIRNVLSSIPALKQGVAFSLADNELNYLATLEIGKWKNLSLEAGYAGRAENTKDKIVAVLSYELIKLKNLGVNIPILDLIEFNLGAYAGYGRLESISQLQDSEFDYGISASLIKVKF